MAICTLSFYLVPPHSVCVHNNLFDMFLLLELRVVLLLVVFLCVFFSVFAMSVELGNVTNAHINIKFLAIYPPIHLDLKAIDMCISRAVLLRMQRHALIPLFLITLIVSAIATAVATDAATKHLLLCVPVQRVYLNIACSVQLCMNKSIWRID